jgi:hypothetical protein
MKGSKFIKDSGSSLFEDAMTEFIGRNAFSTTLKPLYEEQSLQQ